ncbi:hypothetical protein [Frateuria sp. Soil773]|uniref:hypothetical protein n=1 Tax=Frateuria sp. Soil773 TaxID=1736407 RepID=UPI0012F70F9B|nr:hypothetical protein [Frateuria sp. Soil773]
MSKIKTLSIILVSGLIHFALTLKIVVGRLTCDIQPNCVSQLNKIIGAILGFPLGWIAAALHHFDDNFNLVKLFGGELFVCFFINSILAATLIWLVATKSLVRLRDKSRP